MKRLFLAAAAVVLGLAAYGQQAKWEGEPIVSPEIRDNNTVTFRLYAPKADKVQLTGDCLPERTVKGKNGEHPAPGIVDMKRAGKGVWEYTTEQSLAPEFYSYAFIVDGMRTVDPSNFSLTRDGMNELHSTFVIGGTRADLYKINDVPHGSVAGVWYDSPRLQMKRRMLVYTPAGYETSPKERYPVLYLLHGMGGDEESWTSMGRAAQIMDNLIATGRAKPMIVVMTNGNSWQASSPSASGLDRRSFVKSNMKDGAFEESFEEVVNFIDASYRTVKKKEGRAIAGYSMGGFHALHISKYYPSLFDHVGLFSSAIEADKKAKSPVYGSQDKKLKKQFSKAPALYWIAIGKEDFLYDHNREFRQLLDSKGYGYAYYETDGRHTWNNWRAYLSEFATLIFRGM